MRENKPRLTLAAAYIIHERNYLYEYKLSGQDKPRLEKALNVDFVPFVRGVHVLCKLRHIFCGLLPKCSQDKSRDGRTYGYCHNLFYLFYVIWGGGEFALKRWMFT